MTKKNIEYVQTKQEIRDNLKTYHKYIAGINNQEQQKRFHKALKDSSNYVYAKINGEHFMANCKFVGFAKNNIETYIFNTNMRNAGNSDDAISNILGEKKSWGERYTRLLEIYNRLLEKQNLPFSNRGKFFWELNPTEKGNLNYPDEKEYLNGNEGERKKIYVNRYERDPRLRAKCLKRYGHSCAVCEFSFKTVFGDIGNGFIHVHHIRPLSKLGGKVRKINAIEDLIPVCPNCHAMLHAKEGGVYSIYELKKIIAHEKTHQ